MNDDFDDLEFGMDFGGAPEDVPDQLVVEAAAGHTVPVRDEEERTFFEKQRDFYLSSYDFADLSDRLDLDAILNMELERFRMARTLSRGYDEQGEPLTVRDRSSVMRAQQQVEAQLARSKKDLGVNKAARDAAGEESVAGYLQNLLRRAKEFGVHRNEQALLAISLFKEIQNVSGTFLRSNDYERSFTDYKTAEDVLRWIMDDLVPKFDKLDTAFREKQSEWIETL